MKQHMLQDYHLVKKRRNGSMLYRCNHYTHYMKMGSSDEISKEIALYEKLKKHGVPLPNLIGYETPADDIGRMKEESLQGKLYAELFTEAYEADSKISDQLMDAFIAYQHNHLTAQQNTIDTHDIVSESFPKYQFLYQEGMIPHETIDALLQRIALDTADIPHGRNHGDHNAYNIFNDGLIDLEDSFLGPIGYDTITAITQNYWFPSMGSDEGELTRQHMFTSEQIMKYLNTLSQHPLGINFTDDRIFGALFIMRGIFTTVQSASTPLLEKYRYDRLKKAIDAYLGGEHMITFCLYHY